MKIILNKKSLVILAIISIVTLMSLTTHARPQRHVRYSPVDICNVMQAGNYKASSYWYSHFNGGLYSTSTSTKVITCGIPRHMHSGTIDYSIFGVSGYKYTQISDNSSFYIMDRNPSKDFKCKLIRYNFTTHTCEYKNLQTPSGASSSPYEVKLDNFTDGGEFAGMNIVNTISCEIPPKYNGLYSGITGFFIQEENHN